MHGHMDCLVIFMLGAASLAEASCAYGTRLHPRAENGSVEVNTFGYIGATGPTNWVSLDPAANALCATGSNQSPINMVPNALPIIPAAEISLSLLDIPNGAEFENLGTTVEVVAAEGAARSTMSFGDVEYTLQQFHFHLPSEHLDAGTSMAMEMHMVWEGEGGEVAVVGVFLEIDDGTTALNGTASAGQQSRRNKRHNRRQLPGLEDSFFHIAAPSTASTTASALLDNVLGSVGEISQPGSVTKTAALKLADIGSVLNSGSFQTYEGSLTTPPCSEGVRWLVSDQKLAIKLSSYMSARSVIQFNARFPQNSLGNENIISLAASA